MTKDELVKQVTAWKVSASAAFDSVLTATALERGKLDMDLSGLITTLTQVRDTRLKALSDVNAATLVQKNSVLTALDTILTGAMVPDPVPAPTPTPAPTFKPGSIVPLYTYPGDSSWTSMINAAKAYPGVPLVAVVNPASGPGTSQNVDYANNIPKLKAAGIKVIGYVRTNYANKDGYAPIATVQTQVDQWKAWYPSVDGIFFDEMSAVAGQESYYKTVNAYAKSKGFTYTVGNPGGNSLPSYVGTVDTILIRENVGLSALPTWISSYPASNFGMLGYGVPTLDVNYVNSNKKTCGFFYITPDGMPNPWDSLAPYFQSMLAALAAP